ncbi:MAG: dTMP kinase [Candidatus Thermoplasmatota archaeon]|jgi:dTMP kinase|nr:dTMP kinase [Candidatus Thermoplasmatota archaeon]
MLDLKGKFIALEGIDGSGKTELARSLRAHLERRAKKVWITSEPTEWFRSYVSILKDVRDPLSLFLLFTIDRNSHQKEISQKLNEYDYVISDRYLFSSYAYQGYMLKEFFKTYDDAIKWMKNVSKVITVRPELTFYIAIDEKTAIERIKKVRQMDELEKLFNLEKVKETYEKYLMGDMITIDGLKDKNAVLKDVMDYLDPEI